MSTALTDCQRVSSQPSDLCELPDALAKWLLHGLFLLCSLTFRCLDACHHSAEVPLVPGCQRVSFCSLCLGVCNLVTRYLAHSQLWSSQGKTDQRLIYWPLHTLLHDGEGGKKRSGKIYLQKWAEFLALVKHAKLFSDLMCTETENLWTRVEDKNPCASETLTSFVWKVVGEESPFFWDLAGSLQQLTCTPVHSNFVTYQTQMRHVLFVCRGLS